MDVTVTRSTQHGEASRPLPTDRPLRELAQDGHENDKPGENAERNDELTANSPIHKDLRTVVHPAETADGQMRPLAH
jgi:hypothetical protein